MFPEVVPHSIISRNCRIDNAEGAFAPAYLAIDRSTSEGT